MVFSSMKNQTISVPTPTRPLGCWLTDPLAGGTTDVGPHTPPGSGGDNRLVFVITNDDCLSRGVDIPLFSALHDGFNPRNF